MPSQQFDSTSPADRARPAQHSRDLAGPRPRSQGGARRRRVGALLLALALLPSAGRADDVRRGAPKDLDGFFPFEPPATAQEWASRREAVRRRVLVSLGLWPRPTATPLEPVVHGRIDRGDHTIEKVFFESAPGLFVTGNLYRPKHVTGRVPGVLFAHGHFRDARLAETPRDRLRNEIATGAERFEQGGRSPFQSLCVQLARMGCVVWQWDMLGNSDALQLSHELVHRFATQRPEMNRPEGWGLFSPRAEARLQSVMGLQTWNSIRSLDFLLTIPEVDPARIAMTGASGGGTQTMLLAAIDDRLALSYPVVMVSTAMQGGCTCENASLLRIGTGNVEFAGLFAPKPQGMNTADDWTKELATKGFPQLQRLYALLGNPGGVALQRGEHFPHNYNAVTRSGFYTFLSRHFGLETERPVIERDYEPLPRERLTVWDAAHPAPRSDDPDLERKLLAWLDADATSQITAAAATADGLERLVRPALEVLVGRTLADAGRVTWQAGEKSDVAGGKRIVGVLRNATHGEEVPVIWHHPAKWNGDVVAWLGDRGRGSIEREAGRPTPAVEALLAGGASVVGVGLFRQDDPAPVLNQLVKNPRQSAAYTYGYNHTLFAQRVHDLMSVVAFLRDGETEGHERPRRILLAAFGTAGPVAAAARAVTGSAIHRAAIDTGGFRFAALDDWRHESFLPGGAKYLDLPGMLAAQAPEPLWLSGEAAGVPAATAAAYRGLSAEGRITRHDGSADDAALAAARWLMNP